jgi:hypothetical protein
MELVNSKCSVWLRILTLAVVFAQLITFLISCNQKNSGTEQSGEQLSLAAEKSLQAMQVNLQKNLLDTVTVLAVVDNTVLKTDEGAEPVTPEQQKEDRMRRERLVRAALTSNLVRNTKLRIVNPPQALIDEYYGILKSKNANALSAEEAKKAGDALGVSAIVTAFLEDEGKKINVVATCISDGKVIFNETLVGWDFEKSDEGDTKTAEAPGKTK